MYIYLNRIASGASTTPWRLNLLDQAWTDPELRKPLHWHTHTHVCAGALRRSGSIKSETDHDQVVKWGPVTYDGMTSFLENIKGKLCLFRVSLNINVSNLRVCMMNPM